MARSAVSGPSKTVKDDKVKRKKIPPPPFYDALNGINLSTYRNHANAGGCKRVKRSALVHYRHLFAWLTRELTRRLCENALANKRRTVYPMDVQREGSSMMPIDRVVAGIACAIPRRKRVAKSEGEAEEADATAPEVAPKAKAAAAAADEGKKETKPSKIVVPTPAKKPKSAAAAGDAAPGFFSVISKRFAN